MILHLDLDAFFCAVEELHNPALRGKPFAVGGKPEERGVVASCSYAARQFGVRSAMPMGRALKLCPEMLIVPARHGQYGAMSKKVMERLRALTPLVEQISIDEAFLDVSEIQQPAETVARCLQVQIRNELGLPCSLGVASNKLVAKIANNVGKAGARGSGPPNAITVVPPGEEAAFLAPLPCSELWGVGPKTEAKLAELNIRTIGDLANRSPKELIHLFGKNGEDLSRHAKGLDSRTIVTDREYKQVSNETTYVRDVYDRTTLEKTLREQAAEVSRSLQRNHLVGNTVKLKLRWSDFKTITRQTRLTAATNQPEPIVESALALFNKIWNGEPVRLIGVGVSGLGDDVQQLGLWDEPDPRQERLYEAMQKVQQKFGKGVIKRASEIKSS
ncbi:MAG: DNA polymerase IV [Caldilineaceae bacterium]